MKVYIIMEESDDTTEEPHLLKHIAFKDKTIAEKCMEIIGEETPLATWIEEIELI